MAIPVAGVVMRAILLVLMLTGCYAAPVGSDECNAVYVRTYREHLTLLGVQWATLFAHNAFDECAGK